MSRYSVKQLFKLHASYFAKFDCQNWIKGEIYFQRQKISKATFKIWKSLPLPFFLFLNLTTAEKMGLNLIEKCTGNSKSLLPSGTRHSHKCCPLSMVEIEVSHASWSVYIFFFSEKPRTAFQNASCPFWMHVQFFDRQGTQHIFSFNLANGV